MTYKLVIIGGLAAGMKTAAKVKRENPDLSVTVYQEEASISYARCGLPFYISGKVGDINSLILRTPSEMKEKSNIDVYTRHLVTAISPDKKEISIKNLETGNEFRTNYDKLVIATGTKPNIPDIPGVKSQNVFTLNTLEDAKAIKEAIKQAKKAAIIGAGFIGIELAEALIKSGIEVNLLSESDHVLFSYDSDIAYHIENYLKQKGVKVYTKEKILRLENTEDNKVKSVITKNSCIESDLVILCKGTRPETEIARKAGIQIGSSGGIKVNPHLETSIKDIYAGGDCIEMPEIIYNLPVNFSSGSLANIHGRVIGENLTGKTTTFKGPLRTQVMKIFDMTLAKTGLSEKEACKASIDYVSVTVPGNDKAEYYPDSDKIIIKMLAEKTSHRIIGLQIFGTGNVAKRIDTGTTAITAGMTSEMLGQTDLSYAPPYNGPIDVISHAANVMTNKLTGQMKSITPLEFKQLMDDKPDSFILIDIRPPEVFKSGHIKGSINIPLTKLDEKLPELDTSKEIIFNCNIGKTSYGAYRKLVNKGFYNARCLEGGTLSWIGEIETPTV